MNEKNETIKKTVLILRNDLQSMEICVAIKQAMIGMSNLLSTKAGISEDLKYSDIQDSEDIIILFNSLENITSLYNDEEFKKLSGLSQLINDYTYPFHLKADVAELLQELDECVDSENCVDVDWDTYDDESGDVKCTRLVTTGMIIGFNGEEKKFYELMDVLTNKD